MDRQVLQGILAHHFHGMLDLYRIVVSATPPREDTRGRHHPTAKGTKERGPTHTSPAREHSLHYDGPRNHSGSSVRERSPYGSGSRSQIPGRGRSPVRAGPQSKLKQKQGAVMSRIGLSWPMSSAGGKRCSRAMYYPNQVSQIT